MHAPPLRKLNPPLTPNLEEYKQKNKSKSQNLHIHMRSAMD